MIIVIALVAIKPEKQLENFVREDVFRDWPYWAAPLGIDKDGRVWYGHPDANIYAERPTQVPAVTIKGVFTSGQQSFRFPERIVAKEVLEIDVGSITPPLRGFVNSEYGNFLPVVW